MKKRRGERGAALVEAALVLPVVLTLLLGVVEFGFIWKDELTISNATRSAARVGSADGKNAASDYDILQQIKSSTGALPGGTSVIQKVIVWKATSSSTVPTDCLNASAPGGVSGTNGAYCNIYVASDFTRPVSDFNCAISGTSPDHYWCPNGTSPNLRNDTRASADYVGVYILINHAYVTKILGTSRTLADSSIMRIEPTT